MSRGRRRDLTEPQTLLRLWEDVLRVREPAYRGVRRSGYNIYYRTQDNPRGRSLTHHRAILPDKENIQAAYVLADALMEYGGELARRGEELVWFMRVFEDAGSQPAIGADNVLHPSEWLDFGYLIGSLTRRLGELHGAKYAGWR